MGKTIRECYPGLFIYGDGELRQLDPDIEAAASFDKRLRSAWPFVVESILSFHRGLKPREQAVLDPEDMAQDLWITLKARDHKWSIDRGRYISFVGSIVQTSLLKLRSRAKTVRPPGNAESRLKDYERRSEAGELDSGETETMVRLRAVLSDQGTIGLLDGEGGESPDLEVIRGEEIGAARQAVIEGIGALDPLEATALGQSFGLWGQEERRPSQIAGDRRRHVTTIKKLVADAQTKFRARLEAKVAAGKINLELLDR